MKSEKLLCILLAFSFFSPLLVWSQGASSVSVSQTGREIQVSLARPVPLATVLDEVCRQLDADCSGTQQALAVMVPAQQFSGSWRQLIADLLEGAQLNYITAEPSPASPAMLTITGTTGGDEAEPAAAETAARPRKTGTATPLPPDSSAQGTSSVSADAQPAALVDSEPEALPADAASLSAGESVSTGASGNGNQTTRGETAGMLPFPDANGRPASAPQQSPYLPFPDSRGNPIPIANQASSSTYLPFAGSNGNLIPASNQSPQYLLFPASNGRLIPMEEVAVH